MAAREPAESAAMAAWEPTELDVRQCGSKWDRQPSGQDLNDPQCGSKWDRQLSGLSCVSSTSTVLDSLSMEPSVTMQRKLSCGSSLSSMTPTEMGLEADAWRLRTADTVPDTWRQQNTMEREDLCVVNTFLEFRDPAPRPESSRARAGSAPAPAARGPTGPPAWRPLPPAAEVCPHLGPTWGSILHSSGRCRPCKFSGCGCQSGEACRFCHICSAPDRKRPAKGQTGGHFSWRGLRKATTARARARKN